MQHEHTCHWSERGARRHIAGWRAGLRAVGHRTVNSLNRTLPRVGRGEMERSHVEQLEGVRELCEHVSISQAGIDAVVESMTTEQLQQLRSPQSWDKEVHFMDGTALTVQYLLVVDALNFCFWQDEELEYEHLAKGVKRAVEADTSVLDAQRLADITGDGVRKLLGWPRNLPLQEERARLLREVGAALRDRFDGSAAKLVEAAGKSAVRLVQLLTQHLRGFRDHAVYKGRQVFFYKRAQIFVGDLWGAFAGSSWGEFRDIDSVTMFADYRVPVVLREKGVLEYGKALAGKVDGRDELGPGSAEELEVRIATILAVEDLKAALQRRCGREAGPNSVQLDWWLWTEGERDRFKHRPHHRTLTIYY